MVGDFGKALMRAAIDAVAREMRERLGAIRHPETGEFPSVIVEGDSLDDMRFRVEASTALLEIVRQRLSPEDAAGITFTPTDADGPPRAFLSYGSEDKDLAKRIAEGLQAHGVETWWAEWEIGAGDSIRRKIDAGLGACTHFVVLLTQSSIARPWVNEEIDAGYMRKVNARSRFIPLRSGLAPSVLPPLMSGMLSPEIDPVAFDILPLVNEIHGIACKPSLGPIPAAAVAPMTGYSGAATTVAGVFVRLTRHGDFADPQLSAEWIAEETALSPDDVADALYELRHCLEFHSELVVPKAALYAEFDQHWQPWIPADDALRLAADLVNDPSQATDAATIAARFGWPARRLNPAITYLEVRGAIGVSQTIGSGDFVAMWVDATDATRRFVRSRS